MPDSATTRRRFITYFSSVGLSSTLLPGVLWARVQEEKAERITTAMLKDALAVAGLDFTEEQRQQILNGINQNLTRYAELRQIHIDPNVAPPSQPLQRHAQLRITYTDELAMKQAQQADREIAAGKYRGPLHGMPWGCKDIIAVPRLSDAAGIRRVQRPGDRHRGDRRAPAARGRRRHAREAERDRLEVQLGRRPRRPQAARRLPRALKPSDVKATHTLTTAEIDAFAGLWKGDLTGLAVTIARQKDGLVIGRSMTLFPQSAMRVVTAEHDELRLDARGMRHTDAFGTLEEFARQKPWTPAAGDLDAYAGTYVSDEAETTLTAMVVNGKLVLKRRPDTTITLTPLYLNAFSASGGLGTVIFRNDANRRMAELSVIQDRVWNMKFVRAAQR